MKTAYALVVALVSSSAWAQPPAEFWKQYEGMPNVATRFQTYCLAGMWPCVELRVEAWGQTCHPPSRGHADHLAGTIPPGFKYVRWRCDLPADQAVGGIATAGEGYAPETPR